MTDGKKKRKMSDDEVRACIIALAKMIAAEGYGDIKFVAKRENKTP